jgi:putative PIN family toxin of toxin-antitoxin system
VRAVLDPNILISALLSPSGAPAQLLSRWLAGEFELVVSDQLLAELERALRFPKLQRRIAATDALELLALLRDTAMLVPDPRAPPRRSPDPGDDYLLGLAEAASAILVSGDEHVLGLADRYPVQTARTFLDMPHKGGE